MRNTGRTLNRCALETCFSMEFPCLLVLHKAYQLRKMKMYYLLPGQNFYKCRPKYITYPSLPILGTLDGSVLLWALPLWESSPFFTACLIAKSYPTLFDLMDCSASGSSVHGIFQARILKWVAISYSRGSSWPRNWTPVSCIAGRFFIVSAMIYVNSQTGSGIYQGLGGRADASWMWNFTSVRWKSPGNLFRNNVSKPYT